MIVWGTGVCRAMEGSPATSSSNLPLADAILDRVAQDRVKRFRTLYQVLDDNDFSAAFASWTEALELGGSVVADAWMETIADLDNSKLLLEVHQARAAGSATGSGEQPHSPASHEAVPQGPRPRLSAQGRMPLKLFQSAAKALAATGQRAASEHKLTEWRSFLKG